MHRLTGTATGIRHRSDRVTQPQGFGSSLGVCQSFVVARAYADECTAFDETSAE